MSSSHHWRQRATTSTIPLACQLYVSLLFCVSTFWGSFLLDPLPDFPPQAQMSMIKLCGLLLWPQHWSKSLLRRIFYLVYLSLSWLMIINIVDYLQSTSIFSVISNLHTMESSVIINSESLGQLRPPSHLGINIKIKFLFCFSITH